MGDRTVKMNINDYVTVTPTRHGVAVREDHFRYYGIRPTAMEPGEPVRMQMWEVMQTWGPHIGMGLPLVIETAIELHPRDEPSGNPGELP